MRNKKKILIEQLDKKLDKFKDAATIPLPQKGWINTIRTTLKMTRKQLGLQLKLTKGAVQKIEEREATGQITINKLKDVGEALDMQFVLMRTNQNMKLEDQGVGAEKIDESVKELASEIKREMRRALWD